MKKIEDFKMLYGHFPSGANLEYEVNSYLMHGYELYGNPFANDSYIYQAMVKYDDDLCNTCGIKHDSQD